MIRTHMIRRHVLIGMAAGALLATPVSTPVHAQGAPSNQQTLIDRSRSTIEALKVDPNFSNFNSLLRQAKAVIVVPQLIKAGLIVGGEGGSGLLMARNAQGQWSAPAFISLGGASIGLQIGAEASEVVLLVMNNKALDKLLADKVNLGGDVSIAAGNDGGSLAARTTTNVGSDIYAFARNKGLFGGLTLDGGWLTPDEKANRGYYGAGATAHDIVIDQKFTNPGADQLRSSLPS
jgi:lipid-binding SYLF domain-containing protein